MRKKLLRFIHNYPAIFLKSPFKTLIIADVHFGFEAELAEKGIRVPSQTWRLERSIIKLCEEVSAEAGNRPARPGRPAPRAPMRVSLSIMYLCVSG